MEPPPRETFRLGPRAAGRLALARLGAVGAMTLALAGCASDHAPSALGFPAKPASPFTRPVHVAVGVDAGMSVPGQQDLKFQRWAPEGTKTDFQFSRDVACTAEGFASLYATLWCEQGWLHDFGLQVEADAWGTDAHARTFVDRIGGSALPPFDTVREDRVAVLASLLRKFRIPGSEDRPDAPYWFLGVGAGPVYTSVTHGFTGWHIGGQALAGVSVPLTERLRCRALTRFMLMHDQDNVPGATDWRVDTSGTSTFSLWPHLASSPGWPHQDTRFFVFTLGLEYDL